MEGKKEKKTTSIDLRRFNLQHFFSNLLLISAYPAGPLN